MKKIPGLSLYFLLLIFSTPSLADDSPLEFNQPELKQRYYALIDEVRCLVCQNQSLADSNADLAQDLRNEIYQMITDGKTNDQIVSFLVDRYGDFILYRPRFNAATAVLWLLPVGLLKFWNTDINTAAIISQSTRFFAISFKRTPSFNVPATSYRLYFSFTENKRLLKTNGLTVKVTYLRPFATR